MKRLLPFLSGLAFVLATVLAAAPAFASSGFCWRDSYTRGVGTVPQACASGEERIGLLCYSRCPNNMRRFGFDCHSVCPPDMRNDGLFCRKAEYMRSGYGPPHARKKCVNAHGKHQCEQQAMVWYPKCKAGYMSIGPLCRPRHVPDCRALGLKPGLDLSCAKVVIVGKPRTGVCRSGEQKDGGLCYRACRAGYQGVGPVCWSGAPRNWVECGMGAAQDSYTCGHVAFDQVSSVGQTAMFVASLGSSAAVSEAATAARDSARLAELKRQYAALKAAYLRVKPALDKARGAQAIYGTTNDTVDLVADDKATPEDIARVSAEIAALVDPSGVAGTVAAYTYPKCSAYGLDQRTASNPSPAQPRQAQSGRVPPTPAVAPGYTTHTPTATGYPYRPAPRAANPMQQCYDQVQGHVAWDRAGHTSWSPRNISMLCAGTSDPSARIACFQSRIQAGQSWSSAIHACTSTSAPRSSPVTRAAPPAMPRPAPAQPAYTPRAPTGNPVQQCYSMVQGHVAWDRAGHTTWNQYNLGKLCAGVTDPRSRVTCFQEQIRSGQSWSSAINACSRPSPPRTVVRPPSNAAPTPMARPAPARPAYTPRAPTGNPVQQCYSMVQGHVAWDRAGHTTWNQYNLGKLCAGVTDPRWRVACFQSRIRAGQSWSSAISACQAR